MTVTAIDPALQAENPALAAGGVQIDQLREGPAMQAGLASGDVIVSLNHQDIRSVDDFNRIVESLPAQGFIPIRIVRDGRGTTLVLELR